MWTTFWDMHSGGGPKEKWSKIYIEAPRDEACVIFYNRFGHSPFRVTCTCCGDDYSVSEADTLEQASAFHRNCEWDDAKDQYVEGGDGRYGRPYLTVEEYIAAGDAHVIRADEISDDERKGDIPEQGYVWVD